MRILASLNLFCLIDVFLGFTYFYLFLVMLEMDGVSFNIYFLFAPGFRL